MNLSEVSVGRDNNLNLIRFCAAILVIFSHSFPFSMGADCSDMLNIWTHGSLSFGGVAVSIFFVLGGFLIPKSMERLKTGKAYFIARSYRIFPCLIVVVFVTALIVGPLLTDLSIIEYYTNSGTYKYLLNSIFILVHNLPGVFEENIYGAAVNGPLWTLPVEFLCYIMCFIAYKLGFLNTKRMVWTLPVVIVGYIGIWYLFHNNTVLFAAVRPILLFYVGMLFYVYRDKIVLYSYVALLCFVGLILSCLLNILNITIYLFFPYLLFYLGFGTKKRFSNFAKNAEFSYGMYLCGCPIQQTITMLFGGAMLPIVNFGIALPIDIVFAYLLYLLIEKPMTKKMKGRQKSLN